MFQNRDALYYSESSVFRSFYVAKFQILHSLWCGVSVRTDTWRTARCGAFGDGQGSLWGALRGSRSGVG